ncbi:MAG: hypothetical protein QOG52_2285 [Frankiaceae bacterium]|jgi:predicted PhzF superfamily epimerase YddE/YHI9|nr:hypothetical protein [Frankiaceae bacterium]
MERDVSVLRVFTEIDGSGGNHLGVLLESADLDDAECQRIAATLAYSETVFVDDVATATCRIFTPEIQLPFAGHPMVGTAWLLAQVGAAPAELRPPAGVVSCWAEGGDWWVRAQAAWCPDWTLVETGSAAQIDAAEPPAAKVHEYRWAWTDRAAGKVRARAFASAFGIVEDEATGSAAIRLASALQVRLAIAQGRGSRLLAAPVGPGEAAVGGAVVLDGHRAV